MAFTAMDRRQPQDTQAPRSHAYQRHMHTADRITVLMEDPGWVTVDRWGGLMQLKDAHRRLAAAACRAAMPALDSGISAAQNERAHRTIEANR